MSHIRCSNLTGKPIRLIGCTVLALLLVVTIGAASPLGGMVKSPASVNALLTWDQINTDGFGSSNYNTAWSLAVYQNQLVAGTRNPLGAKIWRRSGNTQTWTGLAPASWTGDPSNTAVPTLYNWSNTSLLIGTENNNGAQVWRYDGTTWTDLNFNGFGSASNNGVWTLEIWGSSIIAGTRNNTNGCGLFQYLSGAWTQIGTYGFGDPHNTLVASMAELPDYNLYIGTWNDLSGAEIWLYNTSGFGWVKKGGFGNAHNIAARSMAVFDGELYVGTFNSSDGAEIWRYNQVPNTWTRVASGGFNSKDNIGVSTLYPFAGYLYAGTENTASGAQIWRSSNSTNWEQVMSGGFGDPNNTEVPSLTGFGHWLIAGTRNSSTGGEVWRSLPLGANPSFQISSGDCQAINPDVVFNSNNGEYMVVWENWDCTQAGIYGQRFDEEGQLISPTIPVSTVGSAPQIAYDPDLNRYLVVWNGGGHLQGQLVGANGAMSGGVINLANNGEVNEMVYSPVTDNYVVLYSIISSPHAESVGLNVVTLTQGGLDYATIVIRSIDIYSEIFGADMAWNHAHNELLVAWGEETSHDTPVEGAIVELATPSVLTGTFTIGSLSGYDNVNPSVAAVGSQPAGTGTYLVTWEAVDEYPGTDYSRIAGQKISGNGSWIGEEFIVSSGPGDQRCTRSAGNEKANSFFTTYLRDYFYYPFIANTFSYPFSFGRFLPSFTGQVSQEYWVGGGTYFYSDCADVTGGGGREFMMVKSWRAPTASANQIWATVTSYFYKGYLPVVRK